MGWLSGGVGVVGGGFRSGNGNDGTQREEGETEWATAEGGRGEIGWKDSREQSEMNLDTPDGLKFVEVRVWGRE